MTGRSWFKVKSGQKAIRNKGKEIDHLRDELEDAQQMAKMDPEKGNTLLARKDKEIKELNGFLNIYRQGLGNANRTIAQKEAQLIA